MATTVMPISVPSEPASPALRNIAAYFLMAFGMFMAILDVQIVAASLREIQAGLSASADEIVWVQSSYLIAEVIMIPLSGFLTRAMSTRWLFVFSSLGFTLFSALCATATSINEMIIYRAGQGFLGGAMIPLVFTTAFLLFGRKRVAPMVFVSMIVTLAPTIGPMLGGWITDIASWHWLFLVNLVPGLIISVAVAGLLKVDTPDWDLLKRMDVPGLLLMALTLGSLEYVLEEGARKQWFEDSGISIGAITFCLSAMAFALRLITAKEPIVRLAAFKNYNFFAGSMLAMTGGIGLYGMSYLYPLYLTQIAHLSSGQIGSTLFLSGLAMLITAPIGGILMRHLDARFVAMIGFALLAVSAGLSSQITADWRFEELFWPQILRGSGLMISMVSVNTSAFGTLPTRLIADSAALLSLMRNLGGAIGLAAINTVILTRSNLHWSRAVEHINPARPEVQARLDQLAAAAEAFGGDGAAVAAKSLAQMVQYQVSVLSFGDCFFVMALMFIVSTIVPMLLRKPDAALDVSEAH
jgi:MFS transporter, DHA2 family, multidrug resistance protein